jgi:hypothetical protein
VCKEAGGSAPRRELRKLSPRCRHLPPLLLKAMGSKGSKKGPPLLTAIALNRLASSITSVHSLTSPSSGAVLPEELCCSLFEVRAWCMVPLTHHVSHMSGSFAPPGVCLASTAYCQDADLPVVRRRY